jgi:hypothetical protein
MSNFMKIRPVGTEFFLEDGRTDGRTDVAKLILAFHSFAGALKTSAVHIKFSVCNKFTCCDHKDRDGCGICGPTDDIAKACTR